MSVIGDLIAVVNGNPIKRLDQLIKERTEKKTQSVSAKINYSRPASGKITTIIEIEPVSVENTIIINTTSVTNAMEYVKAISFGLKSSTELEVNITIGDNSMADFPLYVSCSLISFGGEE